jgi:hypothetical protein
MKTAILPAAILLAAIVPAVSHADVITSYTDRTAFDAAASGPLTVEDFTSSFHFPISTGILNSETNLYDFEFGASPIVFGTIEPGATYSTPIGVGNFFNIDIGGGHVGGFLDSLGGGHPLTIDFTEVDPAVARPVSAFGFDLGSIGGGTLFTTVTISFVSGPDQAFAVPYDFASVAFFGFMSDASDITSVSVFNDATFLPFDLDNFTYSSPSPSLLATWSTYGLGTPGTGGEPVISLSVPPVLGSSGSLQISNPYGVSTAGILASSQNPASFSALGGMICLVPNPGGNVPFTHLAGGTTIGYTLPSDPALTGLSIFLQAGYSDPGGPSGLALTKGLRLLFGN